MSGENAGRVIWVDPEFAMAQAAADAKSEADEYRSGLRAGVLSSSLEPSKQSQIGLPGIVLPDYELVTGCGRPGGHSIESLRLRHSDQAAPRLKIWEALRRANLSLSALARFCQCGMQTMVRISEHGREASVHSNNCRNRWCPACGRDRAANLAANIAAAIEPHRSKFLTLTRRHSHVPLSDQIDSIYACFRRLRERRWWRERVRGGAAFLELHRGERDGLWHVHLHILADAEFLAQGELSREWHAITTDSTIVDVRRVADTGHAARYVAKYVSKPASPRVYNDPASLDEMIPALKGRRLCLTFGSFRGIQLEEHGGDEKGWRDVCPLPNLHELARLGDPDAQSALPLLMARFPHLRVLWFPAADSP